MDVDGKITILFSDEGMSIEIEDDLACTTFARVDLNREETCRALSRQGCTPCKLKVYGLDKVGSVHENKTWEFPLNRNSRDWFGTNLLEEIAVRECPEGWEPDLYFSSQNSVFRKDEEYWGRTTVRRWKKPV